MPESLKVLKVFDLQVPLKYFKRNLALKLFLDLPRPWLLLWCTCVLQYLRIFRMCCLIAAPFNPSCTPGDVYLVLLGSYMLRKLILPYLP